MLKECTSTNTDGQVRRWFTDEQLDLIVWTDPGGPISGFQLCYDKCRQERALTWTKGKGFTHERVDDGEDSPAKNSTPILVPDGTCPVQELKELFSRSSGGLEPALRDLVMQKLSEYHRA